MCFEETEGIEYMIEHSSNSGNHFSNQLHGDVDMRNVSKCCVCL